MRIILVWASANMVKIMLLPKPVGKTAITSLPWSNALTAVSCSGMRTISRSSQRIFRHDNASDRAFSTIFLLRPKRSVLFLRAVPWMITEKIWLTCWLTDPMGMASTPAYWTNKKCQPSVQAFSQLSVSQAPRGFAARFHGFAALSACSDCLNCRATQATCLFSFIKNPAS